MYLCFSENENVPLTVISISSCVDPKAFLTQTVYIPLSSKSKQRMDSLELKSSELSMTNFPSSTFIMLASFLHSINDGVGRAVIVARRVIVFPYVTNCGCFDSLTDGFSTNKL